jgi:hypothetical protein
MSLQLHCGQLLPFIVCITITSMDCCIGNAYLQIFLLRYICDIMIQLYWMPMVVGFSKGIQSVICSGFEDTINWLIKKNLVSSKGMNIVSTIGIGYGKVVVVS